jgi:hypothetical protein
MNVGGMELLKIVSPCGFLLLTSLCTDIIMINKFAGNPD